jgi:hypothetical protein
LGLRYWEVKPLVSGFKAVLDRRKTKKSGFMEDWPLIKYPDSPKAANWGIHFSCNKAGIDLADLEAGDGIPGLSFGPPMAAAATGHTQMFGSRRMRKLREAEISLGGDNFRFGVLQHRPFPAGSHIKGWKLTYQAGALWLCLTVEVQRQLAQAGELAAGLDIGWRRTKAGIRFATLYDPAKKSIRELTVDMQRSPKDCAARAPFRLDLGPTRWEKRNLLRLLPDWKPGDPLPNALETRGALQTRRDYQTNTAKTFLRKHLVERTPAWFEKAGRKGLLHLAEEFKDDLLSARFSQSGAMKTNRSEHSLLGISTASRIGSNMVMRRSRMTCAVICNSRILAA